MNIEIRKSYLTIILFAILVFPCTQLAQTDKLNTLILNKEKLLEIKNGYLTKEKGFEKVINNLLGAAKKLLSEKPLSVIEKSVTPPSGNKHDFTSMGPYWWPNPEKKDGLPYIRRDGERNPEYNTITDQEYFTRTMNGSQVLAIAFYITGDSKYAHKAAELIRVWFVDEKTKMNPNMKYAQFIPGINEGRGIGLIETREIYRALDAVTILRSSSKWSEENDRKFITWLEEYFNWIKTHLYGIDESNEKNNHGTWYDVQATAIAIFLGKYDAAKKIMEEAKEKRIKVQIEDDGKQPLELARTKSWNYSCMNLSAFMHLALLAEKVNVDLWNYQASNGGSIRKALDYLLPFALNFDKWEYKQISKFEKENLIILLSVAKRKYDKELYAAWQEKIFGNEYRVTMKEILF